MEDFEHGDSGRRMKAIDKFHHTLEYHHNLFRLAFETDKKRLRLVTIPILILGTIAGFLSFCTKCPLLPNLPLAPEFAPEFVPSVLCP